MDVSRSTYVEEDKYIQAFGGETCRNGTGWKTYGVGGMIINKKN
jgi:hypothetical protein